MTQTRALAVTMIELAEVELAGVGRKPVMVSWCPREFVGRLTSFL